MTPADILALFRQSRALLEGHFHLTSGLHSPQYFQCARVLQYPVNAGLLCAEIVKSFEGLKIDAVIAPALGGIVVGQETGRQLGVRSMFAERKDRDLQLRRGFEILPGENILVCEDVITTGGSVQEVIDIVKSFGGNIIGVGAIVDRSGGNVKLPNFHATMTMDVITYVPEKCPLCASGIPLDKPGSRAKSY